jgi:hypothetical protein
VSLNCSKSPDTSLMSSLDGHTAQSDINFRLKLNKTTVKMQYVIQFLRHSSGGFRLM